MPFRIGEKVRQGANGTVYKSDDGLGRTVAIKLISASAGDANFVLDQARALARVRSPHVVDVITTDTFPDPDDPAKSVPGIVMEWLDGQTFEQVMAGPLIEAKDAQRIGIGMIDGLNAIHLEKLAHTDLHQANVMVGSNFVKILDIQYFDSLKQQSETSQDAKLEGDLRALQTMLNQLFTKSQIPPTTVATFNNAIALDNSLQSIRTAFETAISGNALSGPKQVDRALKRLTDRAFVQTAEYATLLADETPGQVVRPLLELLITNATTTSNHYFYLRAIWSRLSPNERTPVLELLSEAIDETVPDKYYVPHLYMLSAFGESGWKGLSPVTRLRLEKAIVSNIKDGRFNAYQGQGGGVLGTWARLFYPYFSDKNSLVENVLTLLAGNWDTQNYIGEHFMDILEQLPSSPDAVERFLIALTQAYANNPHVFMRNFSKLPNDWQLEIKARCPTE